MGRVISWTFGIGLFALLVCGGGSFRIIRRMNRPLAKCVEAMQEVAKGDYSQRVAVQTEDEIGKLAESMNTAVAATEKAMQELKHAG
jgi:HAMP domain-containing protein